MFELRHISQYIYSMHIVLHPFVSTCYLIGCQYIMLTNTGGEMLRVIQIGYLAREDADLKSWQK